jgi:hypothetical protein
MNPKELQNTIKLVEDSLKELSKAIPIDKDAYRLMIYSEIIANDVTFWRSKP